jgi:SpoVK/Ycf46/Vps4 family AAA+-type ATPase
MESRTTVLFFDEIDALGQARGADATSPSGQGGGADPSSRRVLAEILIQLNRINDDSSNGNTKDGFDFIDPPEDIDESRETECAGALLSDDETVSENASLEGEPGLRERIIVVAATNRPEDCDPALVRRFSVRVVVGLPSQRDRKKILKRYLTGIEHTISKEQLDEIAVATDGWSGSDLESLTREAAMAPVRECIRSAALLKKRIRHREQRGGDSSSQNDHLNETNPHEEQREKLLAQFRSLRTVSFEDFEEAILFWTGNHYTCGSNSSSSDQKNSAKRLNHYDSSSDEED